MNSVKLVTFEFNSNPPKNQLLSAAKLYCEIWQEEPWNEEWTIERASDKLTKILSREGSLLIFAMINDEVCGFVGGKPTTTEELDERTKKSLADTLNPNEIFSIAEIGVGNTQRGQGLGKKLLGGMIERVSPDNDVRVVLHTDIKAESAKRLYASLGFRDTAITDSKVPTHTYWIR